MALRIAIAALVPAAAVLLVTAGATWLMSRSLFEQLMREHGATAADSAVMFQQTVGIVALGALAVGGVIAAAAAFLLARHLAHPIHALQTAARRLEAGDLSARVGARPSIPELATLAETLDSMAAALERQEQVRRDFVAGAAHELLTPLTNLEGYLEGLRDGVIAADTATFASLLEEAQRLTRLSGTLLQLAEVDTSAGSGPVELNMAAAIGGVVALIEPVFARRGLRVEAKVTPDLNALGIPDHVAQVLFNLLQNAGRYSDRDGVVHIAAMAEGSAIRVSVTNPGREIPLESAVRVFERFYRSDASRDRATGGAGIGLALVKQLVEAAGGRVGVDSEPGSTRFWFTLPRSLT
jgi:signal transduction histidine kinase